MTNRYFLSAAILTGLAALAHGIGGEITTIQALIASEVPSNAQVELRAVWHGYTVVLAGSAWLLYHMARTPTTDIDLAQRLAAFYTLGGLIWMVIVMLMGVQNFVATPQWALLLVIGGLTWQGNRVQTSTA